MSDNNRTGVDGTLLWATRLQMWAAGFRIRIAMAIAGATIGGMILLLLQPPRSVDLSTLEDGLLFTGKDAIKLEVARSGLRGFYPPISHKIAALPEQYREAGVNYLAAARLTYWGQFKKYGYAAMGGALFFFSTAFWMGRRETKLREEDRYVRGAQMARSPKALNRQIQQLVEKARLWMGGVMIPLINEITPWSFVGRPRQGKTVAIKSLLDQIIDIGLKIIFDSKGDFVTTHFRPGDLVFAPSVDRRSVRWTIFNDITSLSQVTSIAAALIPEGKGANAIWSTGARQILEGLILHCIHSKKRTNAALWEVCTLPPTAMRDLLLATPGGEQGAALLDKPETPTAFSFYVNLSSWLKPIQLLAKMDGDFSTQKWLATADNGNTQSLYILSSPDHQEALKPVLNLFLNTLLTAHLSMSDNLDRRIWYLLDELAILPKIPKLLDSLNFGPSKGLCALLGYQSYQQLDDLYGRENREVITSATGTNVIFSLGSKAAADVAVDIVGRQDVIESRGTLNTGVTDGRHGGSTMEQSARKELMSADDIKDLRPLNAVIKLLGYPACRVTFTYKPYPKTAVALDPDPTFDLDTYLQELMSIKEKAKSAPAPAQDSAHQEAAEVTAGLVL